MSERQKAFDDASAKYEARVEDAQKLFEQSRAVAKQEYDNEIASAMQLPNDEEN